jgi:hypothetical protein
LFEGDTALDIDVSIAAEVVEAQATRRRGRLFESSSFLSQNWLLCTVALTAAAAAATTAQ